LAAFAATKEMPNLMCEGPISGTLSHGNRPEATVWALPGHARQSPTGGEGHDNVCLGILSEGTEIWNVATVHQIHVIEKLSLFKSIMDGLVYDLEGAIDLRIFEGRVEIGDGPVDFAQHFVFGLPVRFAGQRLARMMALVLPRPNHHDVDSCGGSVELGEGLRSATRLDRKLLLRLVDGLAMSKLAASMCWLKRECEEEQHCHASDRHLSERSVAVYLGNQANPGP